MGNFCCKVLPVPLKLVSYYAANLNFGALFNINVKSAKPNAFLLAFINFGRYLVPTGQTPCSLLITSILFHPRKGLHKPPYGGGGRYCPDVRQSYLYTSTSTVIIYMPCLNLSTPMSAQPYIFLFNCFHNS